MNCEDCELYDPDPLGNPGFRCDPFNNFKEEACVHKWQVFLLGQLLANYESASNFQRRIAPLQEKMFKMVSREVEDFEEGESWKQSDDEDGDDEDDDSNEEPWR